MDRSGPSLVIGHFLPPCRHDHEVIEEAVAHSTSVDVLVLDHLGQRPDAATRRRWLAAVHPGASVEVVPDSGGFDPGAWDRVIRRASCVGDLGDLASLWPDLHPIVRAGLTRRIVVVGAESTGTTTLAGDLADRLSVPWVPEFLRAHAEERAAEAGSIWDVTWTPADFERVAAGQDELETEVLAAWVADATRSSPTARGPLVVCDTDALATALWSRRYLGAPAPGFLRRAAARPPALYLLTSPEGVDFHQDGLRDGEHVRGEMTSWFRTALRDQQVPWVEVTGGRSTRLERSLEVIDRLAGEPVLFSPPSLGEPSRR